MPRSFVFYLAVLLLFGTGIFFILDYGSELPGTASAPAHAIQTHPGVGPEPAKAHPGGMAEDFLENVKAPLSILLLQVIVIVVAARALGALFLKIGQPSVIGEMVAGILLGPSLLGLAAPGVQELLFPASSMGALRLLSQIGVILFMFVVGIELDVHHLRQKAQAAVVVSHASIVVPFFLGSASALLLYRSLAPAGVPFTAFAMFIGVAMSITAFPVLARILEERRLSGTQLGATAIACAAVGDVTAWCLLAVVVAIARANGLAGSLMTIALTLLFIAVMLFAVKPLAARLASRRAEFGNGGSSVLLAGIFSFIFVSALFTEMIGIHALFGAFLAGVCMPPDSRLRQFLRERLETFSSVFLLPLFFAFAGLRTQIGLLSDWRSWLTCAGIIAVAIAGKLGASMIAARFTGMSWGDSFALGSLMNTRGLIELIALNLGYDLGVLSPRIFAMLVLMALVTTLMTGPLLHLRAVLSREDPLMATPARSGS
ncbi:MAG TPA: cation:proton antiporter [Thermoanaerobaculia bacterium]|jgi:Kef-type K+ transport system membrane component KefB|nr:cation:proton antiporter [Thermoanaerobaculia bacterium]